jgi:CYTH domain-containing protein
LAAPNANASGDGDIRDGLIAAYKDRKVRVRVAGDIATVAIKGPRTGLVRPEFEYEIPLADAERMLSTFCRDDTLEKQRFFVEDAGATWHVDVYCGLLQGIVLAEIELKEETQELILPRWVGKEVTGDPFYRKINMRARALQRASAAAASIQSEPPGDPGPI